MEKNNITQMELANAIGVSQQIISRMERDRSKIQVRNLIDMADYFGVSTDEILGYQAKRGRERGLYHSVWRSSGERPDGLQQAVYELLSSLKRCLEESGI